MITKEEREIITRAMFPKHHEWETIMFETWEGFGKLWEWAKRQEWWHSQFEPWLLCDWKNSKQYGMVKSDMVNPENFAKAVADFLQKQ